MESVLFLLLVFKYSKESKRKKNIYESQGIQPYSCYDVVAQLMYYQKQLAVVVILNINELDLPTLHLSAGK